MIYQVTNLCKTKWQVLAHNILVNSPRPPTKKRRKLLILR